MYILSLTENLLFQRWIQNTQKKWYNQIKPKQYKTISIFHGLYSTNYEKGFPGSPSSICNCHCLKSDHFTCRLGSRFIQFHVNFTDKGDKHITENSYFSYMATLTWQQWRSYYNGAIYIIVICWQQMLLFYRQNLQVHYLEWKCMKFIKSWFHDDVIKWKHFPCYWPFVRGTHRSPVGSPHKSQWCGALFFLSVPEQTADQTINMPAIWDTIVLIMVLL